MFPRNNVVCQSIFHMYSIVQLAVCTRMIEVYYNWGKFDHRDLKCAFVLEAFENCKITSGEQRESMYSKIELR